MKEIKLYNRWRESVLLIPIHRNEYVLKCSDNHVRVGLTDNPKEYSFVDPSGGPFLEVGKEIQLSNRGNKIKKKIKSIIGKDDGFHIIFEKI